MYLTPRNKMHTFKESKKGAVLFKKIKMSFNIILNSITPTLKVSMFLLNSLCMPLMLISQLFQNNPTIL